MKENAAGCVNRKRFDLFTASISLFTDRVRWSRPGGTFALMRKVQTWPVALTANCPWMAGKKQTTHCKYRAFPFNVH